MMEINMKLVYIDVKEFFVFYVGVAGLPSVKRFQTEFKGYLVIIFNPVLVW